MVSSPLVLGHDLSDDAQYDAAWPIVSNRMAIAVNQAWGGSDPGRLVKQSATQQSNLTVYHGAGCECVWPGQTLPVWTVWGKEPSLSPSLPPSSPPVDRAGPVQT